MQMTPAEKMCRDLRERIAEACWRADARRAADKDRAVPWSEAGPDAHQKWRAIAEDVMRDALEPVAAWCDQNIMAVGGIERKQYAGYVTEPARDAFGTGKHPGSGYAAFIREVIAARHLITKSCVRCTTIFTTENKRDFLCWHCKVHR